MKNKKILLFITSLFLMSNTTNISTTPFIETTNAKEDLIDSGLIKEYKDITFLDFYEYKYGSNDYSLYFYVFIPNNYYYVSIIERNKIQLSFNESTFYKFSFKLINKEDEFYKFKIYLNDKDDALSYLVESKREYKISGIELNVNNLSNATEFKIGGTYSYSGYAKGCNNNSSSTLFRGVKDLETLDLDVNLTYYRFNARDNVYSPQTLTQLDSVYFSIPKEYLNKYGYVSNINFEYCEYKTTPIIGLRNDVYSYFKNYIGINIDDTNNPGYDLMIYGVSDTPGADYGAYYPLYSKDDDITFSEKSELNNIDHISYLTYLFNLEDSDTLNTISSESLLNYMKNYNSSYFKGKNYKGYSNDLFLDYVDENHTRGYNNINVSSEDKLTLIDYNKNSSWFSRLFNSIFNLTNIEVNMIEKIDSSSFDNELYINENDIDDFKSYYNKASKNDEETYLLRFSSCDYITGPLWDKKYGDFTVEGIDGYFAIETCYLDFDIISLTFGKDGIARV